MMLIFAKILKKGGGGGGGVCVCVFESVRIVHL